MNVPGGIRQLIKNATPARVNDRVWADDAPNNPTFPYVTIADGISVAAALSGDGGDLTMFERETQVDLWQKAAEEDDELPGWLRGTLHRAVLPDGVTGVKIKLRVRDIQRFYERDTRIVHHALTLVVRHDPTGL
ncbi:hypothetical protein [Phycicoccus sp.]|mgnify:CR=1 FL=1|uniref:tail completion protein gp17 n=1 Tax=Phycicoccus sp. TaxID=1902410 RepID=UPI002BE9AC87|nr:hypothetical protein [Phycicoccus sp.]HMM95401.1 hypothetical protein [Phycicoccus sp.]